MAVTFNATPKDPNANSYATVAAADDYFSMRGNASAWNTISDNAVKQQWLMGGTLRLEQEKYKGGKTILTQGLKFPRVNIVDEDGNPLDPDTIPKIVVYALFETVLWLITSEGDPLNGEGLEQFKRLKVGPVDIELRDPITSAGPASADTYERIPGDPAASIALNRSQLPFQVQRLLWTLLITDIPASSAVSAPGFTRLVRS